MYNYHSASHFFMDNFFFRITEFLIFLFVDRGLQIYKSKSIKTFHAYAGLSSEVLVGIMKSQLPFTCSKLTVETLSQGVKYVQS